MATHNTADLSTLNFISNHFSYSLVIILKGYLNSYVFHTVILLLPQLFCVWRDNLAHCSFWHIFDIFWRVTTVAIFSTLWPYRWHSRMPAASYFAFDQTIWLIAHSEIILKGYLSSYIFHTVILLVPQSSAGRKLFCVWRDNLAHCSFWHIFDWNQWAMHLCRCQQQCQNPAFDNWVVSLPPLSYLLHMRDF